MMVFRIVFLIMVSMPAVSPATAEPAALSVIYPKPNSVVGNKVNVVLDPASDWATIPYFQVAVGGTVSEVIETSSGRHAIQGFALQPGMNTVTIKVLVDANAGKKDDKGKELSRAFREVLTRHISVFSRVELFTGRVAPKGYVPELFHSRENEAVCSGCHQLEAAPSVSPPKKPEEVICFACHRSTPTGRHIHGPAAVWSCLSCHNPDLYPVKYQFTAGDPWKVSKTAQPIVPRVFTVLAGNLFKTGSADFTDKEKAREAMNDVLAYLNQNPGERMLIEVHTDKKPLVKQKGKKQTFNGNQALTEARARTLTSLFNAQGILSKRFSAVGMGDSLAKGPDTTPEGRELNDRIEIVAYPADVKVVNSQKLPVLADRKQVLVNLQYAQGPTVAKLRIIETLAKNMRYLPGSSYYRGKALAPTVKGNEVQWELGDLEANSAGTLAFILKKVDETNTVSISDTISLSYGSNGKARSRVFDPKLPAGRSFTIRDACLKCHSDVMNGRFKHGPVDAGNCTLCHDPHASGNAAWLRKSSWELCTTCHDEKATERHVLTGLKKNASHPTKAKRDPARRGKRLTCVSCHGPHSAESRYLFAFSVKERFELCGFCHGKKS
jgi:predicted CXXCH cytochrome family protein